MLGAILPALRTALQTSYTMILGNSIALITVIGLLKGISPTLAKLVSSSLTKRALFSLVLIIRGAKGLCRLISKGLRKLLVD